MVYRNPEIFTIGHSNLSLESFIERLQQYGITAVADVRSHPYSRYLPHFCKSSLQATLPEVGIQYVFLGQELGARPKDLSCYVGGKALYDRIAKTELFQQGIKRLLKGVQNHKICLMCAEQDPINCHRTILICQNLKLYDLSIYHILKNGELESHQTSEERLLNLHQLQSLETQSTQLSLFEPLLESTPKAREYCLQKAYHQQGDKIAYVDKI